MDTEEKHLESQPHLQRESTPELSEHCFRFPLLMCYSTAHQIQRADPRQRQAESRPRRIMH